MKQFDLVFCNSKFHTVSEASRRANSHNTGPATFQTHSWSQMGNSGVSIMALDAYIGQLYQFIDVSRSCSLRSCSSSPFLILITGQSCKLKLAPRNRGLWYKGSAGSVSSCLPVPLDVYTTVASQFTHWVKVQRLKTNGHILWEDIYRAQEWPVQFNLG